MIRSMTGFASASREDERASITVTVKTVNHRHLDLQLRAPQMIAPIEAEIRALASRHVARGRVEMAISLQMRRVAGVEVELNEDFAKALEQALDRARAANLIAGVLTPGDLLRLPQALTIRDKPAEQDAEMMADVLATIRAAVDEALAGLATMRTAEGEHLRRDLDDRRAAVADLVERIAAAADDGRAALEARLSERVAQIRIEHQADEAAVAQEIVRFAARSDISEEVVRFRGHVAHWSALAESQEPCGRKLDFLLQEMNREVNTMGSKADGLRVSELIIAAKAELEKMREQVQNVE